MNEVTTKQQPLGHLARKFRIRIEDVISKYQYEMIIDLKISKASLFYQVYQNKLSVSSRHYLEQMCALPYHRDARTTVEYGKDLIYGWLAEDLVFEKIKSLGIDIAMQGEDKDRSFLVGSRINTNPDFCIKNSQNSKKIELIVSWKKYWTVINQLDIRDSKFRHLQSTNPSPYLLGIEPLTESFFCFAVDDYSDRFQFLTNTAWGNKGSYTFKGIRSIMLKINDFEDYMKIFR